MFFDFAAATSAYVLKEATPQVLEVASTVVWR